MQFWEVGVHPLVLGARLDENKQAERRWYAQVSSVGRNDYPHPQPRWPPWYFLCRPVSCTILQLLGHASTAELAVNGQDRNGQVN